MVSQTELDLQFRNDELETRIAKLERQLGSIWNAGLDRLGESGYVQFDGIGMRWDDKGMQVETDAIRTAAIRFVNQLVVDPSTVAVATVDGSVSAAGVPTLYVGAISSGGRETMMTLVQNSTNSDLELTINDSHVLDIKLLESEWVLLDMSVVRAGLLRLGGTVSDPAAPADGDEWYRTDTDKFRVRVNGVTENLAIESWVTSGFGASTDYAHELMLMGA